VKHSCLAFLVVGLVAGTLTACATSDGKDPSLDSEPIPTGTSLTPSGHLRLLAGNLTTGNDQAYLTPGIHIFKGLQPDVAMIQEFNVGGNTTAELRTFVDQGFGTDYTYARGAASEQIPNGIVSRYPILASGEWIDTQVANRAFLWAQIDIPGPIDLYAISVHLLSTGSSERSAQATELKQHIQALPAGAYVVLAGDFNTDSRTEACITTLAPVLTTTAPYPVDQSNLANTNENRNKPYDWVLVNSNLQPLETGVTIGSNVFAHGLVADTRIYTPIADLAPAVASDSGALNMQHMAVVRDFALPVAPPATVTVTSPNGGETWAAGSRQTIAWTSTGVTNVSVELSTDGTTWTTLSASTPASAGQLAVTAPSVATTAARVRVTSVPGGSPSDTSNAAFTITTTAPPPPGKVFLNEILANEAGSDTAGEFVELVNSGTGDTDLSGWTISDATAVRHTFAAGTVLHGGRAIVVFGGATGIPAGLTNAVAASTGTLSLGNSGDTVTLASPTGTVDSFTYSATLAGTDGVSMNRSPDGSATGTFVLHTTLSTSQRSPGTRVDGTAF
jgi:endonuclease/exonuclease/phosphatase family metal-dependent hydrolase